MRESIMTTYKNYLAMNKSFEMAKEPEIKAESHIVEFAKTHSKKDTFLYNNRLFYGAACRYTKLNETKEKQYTANWKYIKSLP